MAEPDAARSYGMGAVGAGVNVNLETDKAQASVNALNAAIKSLETTLADFGNRSYNLAEKINRNLLSIGTTATKVTGQLGGLGGAVSGIAGGGGTGHVGGTGMGGAPSAGDNSGSGWAVRAASSASGAIARVMDKELPGGLNLGQFVGTGGGNDASGLTKDLVLAPLRYLRQRINTNRDTALMASGALNMASVQQGTGTAQMMSTIARFPGSIYGNPQDMLELFAGAPGLGASYGFGGARTADRGPGAAPSGGQGVRAAGFFKGLREMQMLNPMASIGGEGGLMNTLGGYASNTGAQQKAMMFTGGAMGMIAAGGRQKSLSEWAESILRWFEGLRPGAMRGKGFNYGDLMAQYFPGSNIDAWFNTNQVPQNMRDYWWTYALGKASKSPDTSAKFQYEIKPQEDNVAWQRLKSGSELTRTEFALAGKMAPQYATREGSNRWFNELMGSVQQAIIPRIINSPIGRLISMLPDSIEDLLMTGAERGASALFGGGDAPNAAGGIGDADIGDSYGATGGTGLSGLHPDMKSKVGRMMQANPNLRINSGLRDTGLQRKLRAAGNSNVSGKPSAHTRGMAADLGPSSQYGWIMKNAKRFGLASGKGHGEPWHVGMPGDISGVGDPFDDFMDSLKGFTSNPDGMAQMISKLLNTMTGKLTKLFGENDTAPFADNAEDLYTRLARASKNTSIGINPKKTFWDTVAANAAADGSTFAFGGGTGGGINTTSKGDSVAGTASGWGSNGKTWKGTNPDGRGDRYTMKASADILRDIQSNDAVTRGTAVAKALSNAGFSGDALRNFLRISYRESHWTANAWNSGPVDESGGILQANQLPWTKNGKPSPFTQADAMDPQAAAYIAFDQYSNRAPMNGPGGPNTMKPWTINGNPFGGIPAEATGLADQVLKQTGLGDIEAMQAGMNLVGARAGGAGGITFNNEFKLSVPSYGGGSNGGIDLRRTVTLIADHLEDEMNRRMKRSA